MIAGHTLSVIVSFINDPLELAPRKTAELKFPLHQTKWEGSLKHWLLDLVPQILSQQVWDEAHEFARPSNKFPGDADAAGLQNPTLRTTAVSLHCDVCPDLF